ncbi:MAG: ATP-binding protein [Bacteroidales bacterium]|nr:ATP-binding protein [Bacteroidales bacterium]
MKEDIIGRKSEIKRLEKLCKSKKSEFITIYGRRRVGKTFLVTSLFEKQLSFFASGIIDGDKEDQMSSIKLNGDLVRCSTKR